MSKRIYSVLLAAVLLFISSPIVYSDVVMSNKFLLKNKDNAECMWPVSGRFVVNSPSGYIIPREEPGSEKGVSTQSSYKGTSPGGRDDKPYTYRGEVFIFMNGEIIDITHVYLHNGEYWGVMSYSHTYQPPGWMLMDELLLLYEREDFEEEHYAELYEYTGSYGAVLSAKKLVLWQWPGSDREKIIIEDKEDIINYANVFFAYKDKEGREWGKTKHLHWWICLSDPANSKIPAFNPAQEPVKWSPDHSYDLSDNDVTIWPPANLSDLPISALLGYLTNNIALMAVTAFVLAIVVTGAVLLMRKRIKPGGNGEE